MNGGTRLVATPLSRAARHRMVGCEWAIISKACLSLLLEITWQRCRLSSNRPLQGCWDGTKRRSHGSPMDWRHPIIPATRSVTYCSNRSAPDDVRYLYWGWSCFYFRSGLMNRCQPGVFSLKNIWCVHFYPQRFAPDLMALEGCLNGDRQDAVSIPMSPIWSKSSVINWASRLTIWITWTVSVKTQTPRGTQSEMSKEMWTFGMRKTLRSHSESHIMTELFGYCSR